MSFSLRRVATFILLLTVPLRVYAAAAMVFCNPGNGLAVEAGIPAHHATQASVHGHRANTEYFHSVQEDSAADSHHQADSDGASLDDHFLCGGCCCTGMIATVAFDWKPQAFPTPAMPSFIATTVPSTVPQRLDRPPRAILA